ncbi:MAG TPA: hypothetical protein VM285_01345 [Polyangia bacterium]|nr:hypothetical protein [Polyangia bacterium]
MGCRKATKKVFRFFGNLVTPAIMQSARNIVTVLDTEAMAVLDGTQKEKIAVEVVKDAARREGRQLRTSAALAIVNGLVTMAREQMAEIDEIGEDDSATEAMP